ncbi:hypothetical protein IFM89_028810 [Coptis chinensis]|uniref:MULE transposase domain-containing protein n=1 Tax=Coptis chinensis TaxID=261450 RepID=A0A835IC31_9MAGN|nr:hypothetical protein IFM89_028810 [Coptis chinensis]
MRSLYDACRPLIELDDTHMKGSRSNMCHLSAIALDADGHVFPVIFSLVSKEANENWEWFLRCLRDHVVEYDNPIILMTDMHVSLISKVPEVFPRAKHELAYIHMSRRAHNSFNKPKRQEVLAICFFQFQVLKRHFHGYYGEHPINC